MAGSAPLRGVGRKVRPPAATCSPPVQSSNGINGFHGHHDHVGNVLSVDVSVEEVEDQEKAEDLVTNFIANGKEALAFGVEKAVSSREPCQEQREQAASSMVSPKSLNSEAMREQIDKRVAPVRTAKSMNWLIGRPLPPRKGAGGVPNGSMMNGADGSTGQASEATSSKSASGTTVTTLSSRFRWAFKPAEPAAPVKRRRPWRTRAAFVDAGEMRETVRQATLDGGQVHTGDLYHSRGVMQLIARSAIFQGLSLLMVFSNAVWLAVDVDRNFAETLSAAPSPFQVGEHVFCASFFLEWLVRFLAYRRKAEGRKDAWFCFDTLLVALQVFEVWVMSAVLALTGSGEDEADSSLVQMFWYLRLARPLRLVRLLRAAPELLTLLKGCKEALWAVVRILALLLLIIYVFALWFTQILSGTQVGDRHFPNVPESMYTLAIHGALAEGFSEVMNAMRKESFWGTLAFFVFLVAAAVMLLSILIGMLVQVVHALAAGEKEEMEVAYVKERIEQALQEIEIPRSGHGEVWISQRDFSRILMHAETARALREVGIDMVFLLDSVNVIYNGDPMFDRGREPTRRGIEGPMKLSFSEFIEVILRFRGGNSATVKDLAEMGKSVRADVERLEERLESALNAKEKTTIFGRTLDGSLTGTWTSGIAAKVGPSLRETAIAASRSSSGAYTYSRPALPQGRRGPRPPDEPAKKEDLRAQVSVLGAAFATGLGELEMLRQNAVQEEKILTERLSELRAKQESTERLEQILSTGLSGLQNLRDRLSVGY